PLGFLSALHFSLLFVALFYGLAIATSAIVGQLGVPFACVPGALFWGDRLVTVRIGGIAIAFLGIVIVAGTPNILTHPTAFFIALGSTTPWGIANILVKRLNGISSMQ